MATGQPTHAPTPAPSPSLGAKLLTQADGDPTAEAAAMLLIDAVNGRLIDALSLIWEDDHSATIDWDATRRRAAYLSGGEHRLLALADSLATGRPVDLADTLTGLDDHNSRAVIAAIGHATGALRWGYDR